MKINEFMRGIYGKGYNLRVGLMFVIAFGNASAGFIATYHLGMIIDAVSSGYGKVIYHFTTIAASLAFYMVSAAMLTFFSSKIIAKFVCNLQIKIGQKMCSSQYQEIENFDNGELFTIATKDVEGLKSYLTLLLKIGCLPAQLGLVIVFAFLSNWKFFLFTLCLIPLAAIPEVLLAKNLHIHHDNEKRAFASVLSFFCEMVELLLVIKSFQLEDLLCKKNQTKLYKYQKARMKRIFHEMVVEVYGRCYGHITNVLILMVGAYFILQGEMSIGVLTNMILMANIVGEGLNVLQEIPNALQNGKASMLHINILLRMQDENVVEYKPQNTMVGNDDKQILEIRGLDFRYEDAYILQNINLAISKGEKIAIVGASGCGKTTLLKLLSGLYPVKKHQILFQGNDFATLPLGYIRENIVSTTQEAFMFSASMKENIGLANRDSTEEEIKVAAGKARIAAFIESLLYGYDTMVDATLPSVSNGQMQRINLSRVFLKQPEVLLLDEPTSALDPDTAKVVLDNLFSYCPNQTILMVLHDLREIHRFDKVLMLENGSVAAFGVHKMLIAESEKYKQLYDLSMDNIRKEEKEHASMCFFEKVYS